MSIPVIDHVIVASETGELYSFREHNPSLFEGDYDPDYIRDMLEKGEDLEAVADSVLETTDDFVEEIVHTRTR